MELELAAVGLEDGCWALSGTARKSTQATRTKVQKRKAVLKEYGRYTGNLETVGVWS